MDASIRSWHSLKGDLLCCASFACTHLWICCTAPLLPCTHLWINFSFSPAHPSTSDILTPSKQHYIHNVLESSTCHYQIEIKTPLLCTGLQGGGGAINHGAQMTEGDAAAVQKLMLPLMQSCRKRVEVICPEPIPNPESWVLLISR